jgi:hypothetical protein
MRLTCEQWRAAGHSSEVVVHGLTPCRPWFGQ